MSETVAPEGRAGQGSGAAIEDRPAGCLVAGKLGF